MKTKKLLSVIMAGTALTGCGKVNDRTEDGKIRISSRGGM